MDCFWPKKATYFFGGNTENGSKGKGHGDSNIVISDNGGRVLRAALREAVMTKTTGFKSIYLRFPCGVPFIAPPAVRLTGGA